jgi:hypothetical protein
VTDASRVARVARIAACLDSRSSRRAAGFRQYNVILHAHAAGARAGRTARTNGGRDRPTRTRRRESRRSSPLATLLLRSARDGGRRSSESLVGVVSPVVAAASAHPTSDLSPLLSRAKRGGSARGAPVTHQVKQWVTRPLHSLRLAASRRARRASPQTGQAPRRGRSTG